ncbi:hypothetical protein BDR07DRAFT_1497544 [Suillus spraguei]|nr:hypothetical protein BDR07DRAFT_1497544 [Suillus spraguei]
MPASSSYHTQHTASWLDMQLSSDSDFYPISTRTPITFASTSCIQISGSSASNSNNSSHASAVIPSSWLQLHLSSDDNGHDAGANQQDSISNDLSDILERYVQKHGLFSETEFPSDDDDGPSDDYQPESAKESGPAWIRSYQADDSDAMSEGQDVESSVDIDPMLNLGCPTLWLPALEQLHTLNPQKHVGEAVLNMFLMTKWYPKYGQGPLRYADMTAVAPSLVNKMPALDEIQNFSKDTSCLLPRNIPIPLVRLDSF